VTGSNPIRGRNIPAAHSVEMTSEAHLTPYTVQWRRYPRRTTLRFTAWWLSKQKGALTLEM
jgi:hypothetical protein